MPRGTRNAPDDTQDSGATEAPDEAEVTEVASDDADTQADSVAEAARVPEPGDDKNSEPNEDDGNKGVAVTYSGLKTEVDRHPEYITVIVPDDGKDDGASAITEGETVTMKLNESTTVSAHAAGWLKKHKAYNIRRSE